MSVSLFIANCETTHSQQPSSVRAFGSASFVRREKKSKLNTTEFSSRFGIKRVGKIEKGFSPGAYGERLSLGRNFHFDKPQRGSRPTKNGLAIRWIFFFVFAVVMVVGLCIRRVFIDGFFLYMGINDERWKE